jgi:hypothetical protein
MDLVQRTRRDWLHWAGILVFVNVVAVSPALNFLSVGYFLNTNAP